MARESARRHLTRCKTASQDLYEKTSPMLICVASCRNMLPNARHIHRQLAVQQMKGYAEIMKPLEPFFVLFLVFVVPPIIMSTHYCIEITATDSAEYCQVPCELALSVRTIATVAVYFTMREERQRLWSTSVWIPTVLSRIRSFMCCVETRKARLQSIPTDTRRHIVYVDDRYDSSGDESDGVPVDAQSDDAQSDDAHAYAYASAGGGGAAGGIFGGETWNARTALLSADVSNEVDPVDTDVTSAEQRL
eukprot:m.1125188 g.1125188  ORF g.1125188 m.1125188 type:complete len:249 (+) comp24408_c0_seq42:1406-2152(+)